MFQRIRASRTFQTLIRILQFISAMISLGLFSSRLYKLYRLEQRTRNASDGAVEGILTAAVAYTLAVLLINLCLRSKAAPNFLRWLLMILDILFVGAFIAVADLTSPNGGPSGNKATSTSSYCFTQSGRNNPANYDNTLCQFPIGTFVLAILSTVLHFITAVFNEVRDKHRANKASRKNDREADQGVGGI